MGARYWKRLNHECELWRRGLFHVAGVDEAGRGPLAGPVVAGAVCFPFSWERDGLDGKLRGLNDSKQLTPEQRERYLDRLQSHGAVRWAVAVVDVATIDEINILYASHRAMIQAIAALQPQPEHVLVDGLRVRSMPYPQTALIQGDARSYSIAAASVVAKVTRDRLMVELDRQYPGYGFAEHKGYGTPQHLAALAELGPCPIHRRSFAPVRREEGDLFAPADQGPLGVAPAQPASPGA